MRHWLIVYMYHEHDEVWDKNRQLHKNQHWGKRHACKMLIIQGFPKFKILQKIETVLWNGVIAFESRAVGNCVLDELYMTGPQHGGWLCWVISKGTWTIKHVPHSGVLHPLWPLNMSHTELLYPSHTGNIYIQHPLNMSHTGKYCIPHSH